MQYTHEKEKEVKANEKVKEVDVMTAVCCLLVCAATVDVKTYNVLINCMTGRSAVCEENWNHMMVRSSCVYLSANLADLVTRLCSYSCLYLLKRTVAGPYNYVPGLWIFSLLSHAGCLLFPFRMVFLSV